MSDAFRFRPQLESLDDRIPPGGLGGLGKPGDDELSFLVAPNGKNSAVVPVQSSAYGHTYGEWSAAFWQWLYSMPVDQHPLFDTADVSQNQSGNVWFIGGTFTTVGDDTHVVGTADRDVTIPSGTALFVAVLNAESNDVGGPPIAEADLRADANFLGDHLTNLFATIDGKAVGNLDAFRVESPAFTIGPVPENNVLGVAAGSTGTSVGDGVYLMVKPLPVGEHTLHFGGSAVFTEAADGFDFTFSLDITYHVNVVPAGKYGK